MCHQICNDVQHLTITRGSTVSNKNYWVYLHWACFLWAVLFCLMSCHSGSNAVQPPVTLNDVVAILLPANPSTDTAPMVQRVFPGSKAQQKGLQAGDSILSVGKRPASVEMVRGWLLNRDPSAGDTMQNLRNGVSVALQKMHLVLR